MMTDTRRSREFPLPLSARNRVPNAHQQAHLTRHFQSPLTGKALFRFRVDRTFRRRKFVDSGRRDVRFLPRRGLTTKPRVSGVAAPP